MSSRSSSNWIDSLKDVLFDKFPGGHFFPEVQGINDGIFGLMPPALDNEPASYSTTSLNKTTADLVGGLKKPSEKCDFVSWDYEIH